MKESTIERRLRNRVKALGGIAIKIIAAFFTGLPDRLVLMPGGRLWFVELKAPGEKPRPRQVIVHGLLRKLGFTVEVIDTPAGVDEFINRIKLSNMKTGLELITEERQRQVNTEGWTAEHDDKYQGSHLVLAAVCYALPERLRDYGTQQVKPLPDLWPWQAQWWKPTPQDRIRELQKAGALIAAEIDRIQRAKA